MWHCGVFAVFAVHAPLRHTSWLFAHWVELVHFSWQFYAAKHARPDLKEAVSYFDPGDGMDGAPAGSLFLMPYQSEGSPVSGTARLTQVALVENADRHPAFAIYRK